MPLEAWFASETVTTSSFANISNIFLLHSMCFLAFEMALNFVLIAFSITAHVADLENCKLQQQPRTVFMHSCINIACEE